MFRLLRLVVLSVFLMPCLAVAGYMNKQVWAGYHYPVLNTVYPTSAPATEVVALKLKYKALLSLLNICGERMKTTHEEFAPFGLTVAFACATINRGIGS